MAIQPKWLLTQLQKKGAGHTKENVRKNICPLEIENGWSKGVTSLAKSWCFAKNRGFHG